MKALLLASCLWYESSVRFKALEQLIEIAVVDFKHDCVLFSVSAVKPADNRHRQAQSRN